MSLVYYFLGHSVVIKFCKASRYQHVETHLNSTTAAAIHQIADVSWLNACTDEWLYVVVV